MNNDDMLPRDRIEKLEEVVATTRAQLEKAFVVIMPKYSIIPMTVITGAPAEQRQIVSQSSDHSS